MAWSEHWDFLNGPYNLSTEAGLQRLEDFFKARQDQVSKTFSITPPEGVSNGDHSSQNGHFVETERDEFVASSKPAPITPPMRVNGDKPSSDDVEGLLDQFSTSLTLSAETEPVGSLRPQSAESESSACTPGDEKSTNCGRDETDSFSTPRRPAAGRISPDNGCFINGYVICVSLVCLGRDAVGVGEDDDFSW